MDFDVVVVRIVLNVIVKVEELFERCDILNVLNLRLNEKIVEIR